MKKNKTKTATVLAGGSTTVLLAIAGLTSVLKIAIPSLIFGFVLVPSFIFLVICIHSYYGDKTHPYSLAGISFSIMYGVLIGFNYYMQLTLKPKGLSGLDLLSMNNPNSIMWVIEILGYFFMGLSTLAMAPVFGSTAVEKVVKYVFILNGLLGIGGLIGYALNFNLSIMFFGLILWNIVMPIGTGALTYHFITNKQSVK